MIATPAAQTKGGAAAGPSGPAPPAGRAAREVLEDHLHLRRVGDLDEDIRRNYHPKCVMITPRGASHGVEGIRHSAQQLYRAIPDPADYEYKTVICDDRMALLEWCACNDDMAITDGVDSFLIEDGLICAQTIRYTVTFSDLSEVHGVE